MALGCLPCDLPGCCGQGSGWLCNGFIWLLNGRFPHDFLCSHFISNLPVQRHLCKCGHCKEEYCRFHRERNSPAGTSSILVGFILKSLVFWTFLDFLQDSDNLLFRVVQVPNPSLIRPLKCSSQFNAFSYYAMGSIISLWATEVWRDCDILLAT